MRRRLIILGTSGFAREMEMLAEEVNTREQRWDIFGFVGDSAADAGKKMGSATVLGDDDWLLSQDFEADLMIGIGYPRVRARVLRRYLDAGDRFGYPNFVHPTAVLSSRRVQLGVGNAVTAGCKFTCDIHCGNFNLFNLNTTVGHDCRIGSYNVLNPGVNVSGCVTIGDRVLVGTGCQILEHISVGSDCTLGASSLVRCIVPDGQTVVGVPALPLTR